MFQTFGILMQLCIKLIQGKQNRFFIIIIIIHIGDVLFMIIASGTMHNSPACIALGLIRMSKLMILFYIMSLKTWPVRIFNTVNVNT